MSSYSANSLSLFSCAWSDVNDFKYTCAILIYFALKGIMDFCIMYTSWPTAKGSFKSYRANRRRSIWLKSRKAC